MSKITTGRNDTFEVVTDERTGNIKMTAKSGSTGMNFRLTREDAALLSSTLNDAAGIIEARP